MLHFTSQDYIICMMIVMLVFSLYPIRIGVVFFFYSSGFTFQIYFRPGSFTRLIHTCSAYSLVGTLWLLEFWWRSCLSGAGFGVLRRAADVCCDSQWGEESCGYLCPLGV